MAEPLTVGGILGLKYTTLLGGFLGALVSLSFVTELGWWGRLSAVLTGTVTAAYATPVIVAYWTIGSAAENGIGFLIGLTSMNLIPMLINASKWLRCNIKGILARRFGAAAEEEK